MTFQFRKQLILIITLILFLGLNLLHATTPMNLPSDSLWSDPQQLTRLNRLIRPIDLNPMRDNGLYIQQFIRICTFLDSMQESNQQNQNFGGLHEGEGDQLWRIVETDNTQEAIRVWCEYALYFEEPDTYDENIDAAWVYLDNNPAWEEDHPSAMYTIHNCGWGLVAEERYRQAYDDRHRDYGIQCADHLVEHTPDISVDMGDRLIPLAAGWAAGTLYNYGLFEENDEYIEAALVIGNQVQAWIDEDPDRLNENEIWALCGGTAMWGVLQSVGKADSAETADWAIERLENMDVIAGGGRWNSSWNIWYAHAWLSAFELVAEEDYRINAEFIVDSLLALDTDEDGGIPATIGDEDNLDQSWVSAYTAWMGLSNMFDYIPEVDVAMGDLLSPTLDRSWPVDRPFRFIFTMHNAGFIESVECPIIISGGIEADTIVTLDGWLPSVIELQEFWVPEDPGEYHFDFIANHEDDHDPWNDTLSFNVTILPTGTIGIWSRTVDGVSVESNFYIYNVDIDPNNPINTGLVEQNGGLYQGNLMIGNYRMHIVPEFPYAEQWINEIVIIEDEQLEYDLEFTQPPVLLIDKEIDTFNSHYYTEALESVGYTYYHLTDSDSIDEAGFSAEFSTIIYFTGNRDTETIPQSIREEFLLNQQNGGSLFITGQYIADDNVGDEFMNNVLHTEHLIDDANMQMVEGVEGDEVFDGFSMLIFGNRGANNQRSPSGIGPANGGIAAALYRNRPDTAAVVRWEDDNGAKGVFFAFGFEAISGQVGNSRDEVMRAVLEWLDTPNSVGDLEFNPTPTTFGIQSVYPNPFNSSVTMISNVNGVGRYYYKIYDTIGRNVVNLPVSEAGFSHWNGMDIRGVSVPAGSYFIVLNSHGESTLFDTAIISLIK